MHCYRLNHALCCRYSTYQQYNRLVDPCVQCLSIIQKHHSCAGLLRGVPAEEALDHSGHNCLPRCPWRLVTGKHGATIISVPAQHLRRLKLAEAYNSLPKHLDKMTAPAPSGEYAADDVGCCKLTY